MVKSILDEVLTEAGIDYIHLSDGAIHTDDKIERSSWKKCTYKWEYQETHESGERTVAVRSENDALKLINYWNRTKEWKYTLGLCKGG